MSITINLDWSKFNMAKVGRASIPNFKAACAAVEQKNIITLSKLPMRQRLHDTGSNLKLK